MFTGLYCAYFHVMDYLMRMNINCKNILTFGKFKFFVQIMSNSYLEHIKIKIKIFFIS